MILEKAPGLREVERRPLLTLRWRFSVGVRLPPTTAGECEMSGHRWGRHEGERCYQRHPVHRKRPPPQRLSRPQTSVAPRETDPSQELVSPMVRKRTTPWSLGSRRCWSSPSQHPAESRGCSGGSGGGWTLSASSCFWFPACHSRTPALQPVTLQTQPPRWRAEKTASPCTHGDVTFRDRDGPIVGGFQPRNGTRR